MSNIKYCPNCQKEHDVQATKCACGYEFVIKEVVDETVSTNTTVYVDPTPSFLWKLISILCPIAGFILFYVFKNKWQDRSKICFKYALGMIITIVVVCLLAIIIAIGFITGDIV